jgi:predicted MFS family arabinose efflux permease
VNLARWGLARWSLAFAEGLAQRLPDCLCGRRALLPVREIGWIEEIIVLPKSIISTLTAFIGSLRAAQSLGPSLYIGYPVPAARLPPFTRGFMQPLTSIPELARTISPAGSTKAPQLAHPFCFIRLDSAPIIIVASLKPLRSQPACEKFDEKPRPASIGELRVSFGLGVWAGAVSVLSLLGYAVGLLLLVPVIDIAPNRPVMLLTMTVLAASLLSTALAGSATLFLVALFAAGAAASGIQMLVPSAGELAPESQRGRVVGSVMSGLMLGIMISRPLASFVSGVAGWRSFYGLLAIAVVLLTIWLASRLPRRDPGRGSYSSLIVSFGGLLQREPILRERVLYQTLLMGAFNVFWTSVVLLLSGPDFHLGAVGIGIFAFAGAGGAIAAPLAGRAADAGYSSRATVVTHLLVIGALILAGVAGIAATGASREYRWPAMISLVSRRSRLTPVSWRTRRSAAAPSIF